MNRFWCHLTCGWPKDQSLTFVTMLCGIQILWNFWMGGAKTIIRSVVLASDGSTVFGRGVRSLIASTLWPKKRHTLWSSYIRQISADLLTRGGIFSNHFIVDFSPSVPVKEFWNRLIFGEDMTITKCDVLRTQCSSWTSIAIGSQRCFHHGRGLGDASSARPGVGRWSLQDVSFAWSRRRFLHDTFLIVFDD